MRNQRTAYEWMRFLRSKKRDGSCPIEHDINTYIFEYKIKGSLTGQIRDSVANATGRFQAFVSMVTGISYFVINTIIILSIPVVFYLIVLVSASAVIMWSPRILQIVLIVVAGVFVAWRVYIALGYGLVIFLRETIGFEPKAAEAYREKQFFKSEQRTSQAKLCESGALMLALYLPLAYFVLFNQGFVGGSGSLVEWLKLVIYQCANTVTLSALSSLGIVWNMMIPQTVLTRILVFVLSVAVAGSLIRSGFGIARATIRMSGRHVGTRLSLLDMLAVQYAFYTHIDFEIAVLIPDGHRMLTIDDLVEIGIPLAGRQCAV